MKAPCLWPQSSETPDCISRACILREVRSEQHPILLRVISNLHKFLQVTSILNTTRRVGGPNSCSTRGGKPTPPGYTLLFISLLLFSPRYCLHKMTDLSAHNITFLPLLSIGALVRVLTTSLKTTLEKLTQHFTCTSNALKWPTSTVCCVSYGLRHS